MPYRERGLIEKNEGLAKDAGSKAVEMLIYVLRGDKARHLNSANVYALSEWLREKMKEASAGAFNRQELNKLIAQALYDLGDILLLEPSELREPLITKLQGYKGDITDLLNEEVASAAGYPLFEGEDEDGFRQLLQQELDILDSEGGLNVSSLPTRRYMADNIRFAKERGLD